MIVDRCQRHRDRRTSYRPAREDFDPAAFAVDQVARYQVARPFVERHHYSGSFPAATFSAGLYRGTELVGVCTFAGSSNERVIPAWTGLETARCGAELSRLVLLDDVLGNAESWFVKRAFALLRQAKPEIEAVLSYADPARGHVGTVYQALSARYRGRSGVRTAYHTVHGRLVSGRTLSKLRLGERGAGAAAVTLAGLGCPPRQPHEDGDAYVARLQREGAIVRSRHPGNHAYVFPLTLAGRMAARDLPTLPYPKLIRGDVR